MPSPEDDIDRISFFLALEKLAVSEYGKLILELRGRQIEPLYKLIPGGFSFFGDELVDLLLQIGEAIRPLQSMAVPEDLLGPLSPGIADPYPASHIDIAVLAEGLSLRGEDLILGYALAAVLAFYAVNHKSSFLFKI